MKKIIALMLALVLVLSFAACGSKEEVVEETVEEIVEETTDETTEETVEDEFEGDMDLGDFLGEDVSIDLPIATTDGDLIDPETGDVIYDANPEEETESTETGDAAATLQALQNIWAAYGEEEKFPIMGGNPEAGLMDAPGSYDMAYAENLGYNLVIPAEQLTNVTEAATMIHMMNANTFTCGTVKLADGVDAAAFAQAVRDALQGNQWICGFPETLVIADLGGIVLIAFGVNDAMTPFMANLTEAYADAQILFNEAIAG